MSAVAPASALAPFRVRSFRFQWPADLATSWAFEMETLILGWYVLAETRSVFMLTLYASLRFIGTLLAPMFGVMGDRIGARRILSSMRAFYATAAACIMVMAFTGVIAPVYVLIVATFTGLVFPSDIGMRNQLVGENMPRDQLVGAMGLQRTTQDSARIFGALTGAGLVALLGIGWAYLAVTVFYGLSALLTFNARTAASAAAKKAASAVARSSPWRDLREGFAYIWNTPHLLGVMLYAFLLNATAFPLFNSLLPYVAKEMYGADQTTLGYMVAGGSFGALTGSLVLSRFASIFNPSRLMVFCGCGWFAMLLVFAQVEQPSAGIVVLMLAGFAQSMGLIPMAAILLRNSEEKFRGRVMGIRMLAIYGNLPGLLISGPLIVNYGYPFTATLYCLIGLVFTALIIYRWRAHLWQIDAPTNVR